jgi:hypothetical protein
LKSHVESSFHSLILSLPLFCICHFRRLHSFQFLCSQAHIAAAWRLETRLFAPTTVLHCRTLPTTLRVPHGNTASLVTEGYLLIRCVAMKVLFWREFTRAGMCLRNRCVAMGVHVTL